MNLIKKVFPLIFFLEALVLSIQPAFAESTFRVFDTEAGKPALVLLTGKPKEVVTLTITSPLKATSSLKVQLPDSGTLQYAYDQGLVAGRYEMTAQGSKAEFFVSPGLPDAKASRFELADYTAKVGETLQGKIILKDPFGNAVSGKSLEIVSKGLAVISCSNACITNQKGSLTFSISSEKSGLKKLQITDLETGIPLFTEDIGFLPRVGSQRLVLEQQDQDVDYIPVSKEGAKGNSDEFFSSELSSFFLGDLLASNDLPSVQAGSSTLAQNTGNSVDSFEIVIGTDTKAAFEPEKTVTANTGLDFIVRAVDAQKKVITNYTGDIHFDIKPSGPLLPQDYRFKAIDQGVVRFELSLVLSSGKYTFTVQDKNNAQIKGDIVVTAKLHGAASLNNTALTLQLESPITASIYAKKVSAEGSTNTDNTEITISEQGLELKKAPVDAQKRFQFPLELSDGKHKLEVKAVYLVDGSESKTTVEFEIDQTPPVIVKGPGTISPVRAGNPFSLTVEAEEKSILKAFINNRAYEFTGDGKTYTLRANAPFDTGTFPINLQISDLAGNIQTEESVSELIVTEPLKELKNLFGIPGIGTMTLSWDPLKNVGSYEVSYESILGLVEKKSTDRNAMTIEKLDSSVGYIFTVLAKDSASNDLSLPTKTRSLKPLEALKQELIPTLSSFDKSNLRPAAPENVETIPKKNSSTGPEVYLLIFISILLLNLYGRIRKVFAKEEIHE